MRGGWQLKPLQVFNNALAACRIHLQRQQRQAEPQAMRLLQQVCSLATRCGTGIEHPQRSRRLCTGTNLPQ